MTRYNQTTVVVFVAVALVIASGTAMSLAGTPGDVGSSAVEGQETTTVDQNETTTTGASYTQTPHMGCQPGAIEKNG